MSVSPPDISVVIPVYNEQETLPELLDRLTTSLQAMNRSYEIIMVDDGSVDSSLEILESFQKSDNHLYITRLSRNFGQSPALYAGLAQTKGAYVIMLDADLQVFPEDISILVQKLDEGFDIVTGWRSSRQDNLLRRAFSRSFNWYVGQVTGLPIHDYGCALKGVRQEFVKHLCALEHRCRYLPADLALLGGRCAEVNVRHSERKKGSSKYGFIKLVRTAFDMITSITDAPLRYVGYLGWVMALLGFIMGFKVAFHRIYYGDLLQIESVISLFFACTGVQLIAIGLLCEYIGRIYIEVQKRPYFVVRDQFEDKK